jgi:hypothetical protein
MKLRALVLLALVTGCGQAATAPSKAGAETVYVAGSQGGVPGVYGLDPATGRVAVDLPLAVPAPGWKRLYAVSGSVLRFLDLAGNQIAALDLPPAPGYALPQTTFDGRPGGLSQDGRWLVLDQSGATARSSFLLVNTNTREITHRVNFDGWYEFDAIDNSGTRLYLIHHFADQPGRYEVAKYSFPTGEMQSPIIEKTGKLRVMQGNRVSTLPDPNGHWQYSLYRGGLEGAFIHTLSLDMDYGTAWCVDLPGGGTPDQQLAWSITMSPDGKRLYAVNPVLNRAIWYNIDGVSPGQAPVLFRQSMLSAAGGLQNALGTSALSPDVKRLVVGTSGGVVVLEADRLDVVERWATNHHFQSLAFSPDGASVYGLDSSGLVRIDARTGQAGQSLASPVNPTSILGVRAV